MIGLIESVGRRSVAMLGHIGGLSYLLLDTLGWIWRGVVPGAGRVRIGRDAVIGQVVRVGVSSIAIVSLVSGAIGLILAFQMAPPLEQLGQKELVPNILAVAVVRELGPLIAAVVLTGFAGASIAAEIGTMAVNEEIEALRATALNPVRFLVVPRLLATVVSMGCLAVLANFCSLGAGAAVSALALGVPWVTFYEGVTEQIGVVDFLTGLAKSGIFGMLIGLIACGNGLAVRGGAEGVGNATTKTVVESVVAIVIADLLFTVLFYALGLF